MDTPKKSAEETLTVNRREFLGGIAAASAFTIIPRSVLGGPGRVAPSDRLNIGQIGCGTQAQRQVDTGLVTRDDLQIVCVCDPNTDSSNYVDWSRYGNRDSVRRLLEDPTWGENDTGIRAGREVAREIIQRYYAKTRGNGDGGGVRAYADFRELFDREDDLDAVVIITPDHAHATLATAALKKGVAAISHKPVSNVLHEVHVAVQAARDSKAATHLLAYADIPDLYTIDAWLKAGAIGTVREVHNWTNRPFWPQGYLDYPVEQPPVPAGFDWDLWLGPEPHLPYHPALTFAVYRGWYNFGGGCFADMGNYSLWGVYRILDLDAPVSVEARANSIPFIKEDNVAAHRLSQVSYPLAGTVHFHHAAKGNRAAVDVYWYEGGLRPKTPSELMATGEELETEGMMFVGDHGTILCGYRATNPRILGAAETPKEIEVEGGDSDDEWVNAVRNGTKSRGSFESVSPLAEATAMQGIAFRFAGKRLDWDAGTKSFTNVPEANQLIRRDYRPGWEL